MAGFADYPANYLLFNEQKSKNLAIIMQIEGVDELFGISDTFTLVRYGDPGIVYGLPGLVYGGLRGLGKVKPYIVLDGSMTIGQRIEPEQGKGNVGMLTMTLIDKNGEISKLIAPGVVLDEIILKREVRIFLGFKQTSFPEDYLLVYKGYITQTSCPPGLVKFQISDGTSKKRQPICNTPKTRISSAINSSVTAIPVDNTEGFHQQILGPDGSYDPIVATFIRIDDEIMEYGPAGITSPVSFSVTRGSLNSTAVSHDIDTEVSNAVQLGTGPSGVGCIILALKILLSGWNGPCETDIPLDSFVYTGTDLGFVANTFRLSSLDAVKDLGLSIGDYFYISGATNSGNNVSGIITGFADAQFKNQIVYTDQTFILENPTPAVIAFRSQYDTLPITCGLKLRMRDVDVATFLYINHTYFTAIASSNMRFYFDAPQDGKDLIDTQIFLPIGCYGISRFGRVSMSITKPPLPGVGKLIELNWTNVLEPEKIIVTRATNARGFYNLISFEYNKDPISGNYSSLREFLDTDSLNRFDQVSKLPIQADGLSDDLSGATISQNRGQALLNRYKTCVLIVEVSCNWSAGSLIEVSDIVLLRDEGRLKIMNFETGERNLGVQLFEVIDRQYNIVSGTVKLKLMGGLGFSADSRFALYSPSSNVNSGSTTTSVRLKPSWGQTSIVREVAKWTPFIGLRIQVHSYDWSVLEVTTISSIDPGDPTALLVDPPLSFTPSEDYIVDINTYPTGTNPQEDATYKLLYAHLSPTIPVVSGTSSTVFDVSAPDALRIIVGNSVILRNTDYSSVSPEVTVSTVVSTTVTVAKSLGFTPDNTYFVEGIGFKDGGSYYRYD